MSTNALAEAFRQEGHVVTLPPRKHEDRPDLLMEVSGYRVACECVQIPPAYAYKHVHAHHTSSDWQGQDLLSVVWANEPHQWIADAIRRKSKKAAGYLTNAHAKKVWLLVHPPAQDSQFFISDQEWVFWALRHGCKMQHHPFEQIYLWIPHVGIRVIYVHERDAGTHSELGLDFTQGYPTLAVDQATLKFQTPRRPALGPIRFDYEHLSKVSTLIRPKDSEYAKHAPASRNPTYHFAAASWFDRTEVVGTVQFSGEGPAIPIEPMVMTALQPGIEYWCHYVFEYPSPNPVRTLHRVQPF